MTERADWASWRERGDEAARRRLIERHMGLAHHFAGRMESSAGGRMTRGELSSAGLMGLVEAVDGYDPERGYRFSTYAARRIRGAILDEMRSRDPVSRTSRRRQRELRSVEDRMTVRLDRRPRHEEVAEELEVEASELWRWKRDANRGSVVSMDAPVGEGEEAGGTRLGETLEDPAGCDVEDRLVLESDVARLRDELAELDERDRLVLSLYDLEGLNLKEIAEVLEVSESRVSQIRTRALGRLRSRLTPAEAA